MNSSTLRQWLHRTFGFTRPAPRRPARPCLEPLEARCVPTVRAIAVPDRVFRVGIGQFGTVGKFYDTGGNSRANFGPITIDWDDGTMTSGETEFLGQNGRTAFFAVKGPTGNEVNHIYAHPGLYDVQFYLTLPLIGNSGPYDGAHIVVH
jgi:hypothetical protein